MRAPRSPSSATTKPSASASTAPHSRRANSGTRASNPTTVPAALSPAVSEGHAERQAAPERKRADMHKPTHTNGGAMAPQRTDRATPPPRNIEGGHSLLTLSPRSVFIFSRRERLTGTDATGLSNSSVVEGAAL